MSMESLERFRVSVETKWERRKQGGFSVQTKEEFLLETLLDERRWAHFLFDDDRIEVTVCQKMANDGVYTPLETNLETVKDLVYRRSDDVNFLFAFLGTMTQIFLLAEHSLEDREYLDR